MRPWQFGKAKGPGIEIGESYYLSVLCSRSVLPSIYEVVNPNGDGGAAVGLGAPLSGDAADRAVLRKPMGRGAYAITTKDRKTVIELIVVPKEEVGFDPDQFATSSLALDASPELVARLRGTWNLAQLRFRSYDPAVYPALDFFLGIAARIAMLAEGVVADAISLRYLLPEEVFHSNRMDPGIDARDHVTVGLRERPDGIHAYTLGLRKFNQPEHEILNLFEADQGLAKAFLLAVTQKVLLGDITRQGDQFGAPKMFFEAREGGFDQELWHGTPVFELLPPTAHTAGEALRAWAKESGMPY
jgi:hypothetical protein